jgi:hypothetical protein
MGILGTPLGLAAEPNGVSLSETFENLDTLV